VFAMMYKNGWMNEEKAFYKKYLKPAKAYVK
jgi:hypothetical protein